MYEMRMDMADFDNQTSYVKYNSFNVGNEASKYRVTLHGYSGNVDDCFTTNTGINYMMFSTPDKDNDRSSLKDCANKYQAGWWYRYCHCANPNGKYLAGNNTQLGVGITYKAWRGQLYSLKSIQFMVKPHHNYSTHVPEIMETESETYLNI
uniref:Fibrinogen C domain-containing protein 1 n=1 Tax=Magallana gigas TaxID=29159 RepID=K1Q7X7_MAGGI